MRGKLGFIMASTGAIAALVLVGCANTSHDEATDMATADTSPEPSPSEEPTNVVELGDGHLTFEVPRSWNAEFEDLTDAIIADGSAPEFNGRPAQQAVITNPGESVYVDVFTNVPWPDTVAVDPDEVELIHAEPFDMGYDPADDGDGMWLRTVIGENPELVDPRPTFGAYDERFEGEQYILVVAPYFAKADLGEPDELGGGMTGVRFPFSEETAGSWWDESITIAAGTISQQAAEELTGAEGLEAMQAVVETEEYEQLFDVISSFQVHVDAE